MDLPILTYCLMIVSRCLFLIQFALSSMVKDDFISSRPCTKCKFFLIKKPITKKPNIPWSVPLYNNSYECAHPYNTVNKVNVITGETIKSYKRYITGCRSSDVDILEPCCCSKLGFNFTPSQNELNNENDLSN